MGEFHYGIAYHDIVIQAINGEPILNEHIMSQGKLYGLNEDDIFTELEWLNLTVAISNLI